VSRIRRLPDHLVNKIAAGEVVERPASVVKELLENAIDAEAATVTIDLRDAGRQLIRVVDDGTGMTPDELVLALERHATSKIASEEDLETIHSLGFRGEALPAIFSVSRFAVHSATGHSFKGSLIRGEGGEIRERLEIEGGRGTTVEVSDLFFNTPARLKFMKSPQAELSAALKLIGRLALAHPTIHLRVIHNGKAVLTAPRAADFRDRMGALLGYGLAEKLLAIRREERGVNISGLIAPPAFSRGSREEMVIIVNGRPIRDSLLLQTVMEAYRPLLPRDQYPIALIRLELPPQRVDVNVHPTKAWVRFRDPRLVQEILFTVVQEALRSQAVVQLSPPRPIGSPGPAAAAALDETAWSQVNLFREAPVAYVSSLFGSVVGQLQETFVVSANDEEVFFIDQHVAHERVLFERLKADLAAGPLAAQELLFPEPLPLSPANRSLLTGWTSTLESLGFSVEGFGGETVVLRAVPALLKGEEPRRLIEALLDEIRPSSSRADAGPLLDRVLAFVACRAAIKANHPLAREEMSRLLTDLSATVTPYFCPHGRPIVSRIPLREIRRELKRTW
jgi:DNA mismatch repair protein MutL